MSSSENGVAASLVEQARLADGEKCSAQTELRQLQMRQSYLKTELARQEQDLAKTFGKVLDADQTEEELRQRELMDQVNHLNQQLTRAEADDKAVGNINVLTGKYDLDKCFGVCSTLFY